MNINISQCENENVLHLLLWSDLCWSTTSQEGNSGLEFPPFVHNLSDCGFMESKLFRDGFVTFLAWWATSTLFLRSSVICFVHDMIHMTKKIFFERVDGSYAFEWLLRHFDVIHWPFCAAPFKVELAHWVGCLWFKRSAHNITSSACQISKIPQITKAECRPLVNAFSVSSSLNVQEQTREWQCKMIAFLGSASGDP